MGLFEQHGNVTITPVKFSEFSPEAQDAMGRLTAEAFALLGEPQKRPLEEPWEYEQRVENYWVAFNAPDPQPPRTP